MRKRIICTLIVIFLLLAFSASVTIEWLYDMFGHLTMDEIVFHLKVPVEGSNTDIIIKFIKQCILKVIIPTIIISFALIYPMVKDLKFINRINTSERKRTEIISLAISLTILIVSLNNVQKTTDIKKYIQNQINDSQFIENEYIDPKSVKCEFGEEKRNLIYIYLESMESTFYSVEDGGLAEKDLIPEISKLAKENINFSNTDKLGGAHCLYGTTWTVGAMSAQTSGVPLKIGVEQNSLGEYSTFLGGAYSIGQILENNGYKNFLLLGSEAIFGGRKNLFEQHGNYEIWDYESAIKENRISEKVWWGYSDDLLFEFAKEKILYLAGNDQPFNFTMLTADTHFPDGYQCADCKNQWDEQYKNVLSCSSRKVGEFVNWIKQQEFYENTTIVISGDHLTMQSNFFELAENQQYDKTVVNVIINSAVETENVKNRQYSTLDLYPTTLAAMGGTIDGDKLALGTNLFSNKQTLIEKYGIKYVNDELMKASKYYDKYILVSK